MDFKQLEAFITVSKLKSFSKAANAIYLSQPTISSHISSLERELNIQLFDRTSKEVNLTPIGESFLHYANDIINTRNNAIADLANFNNNISGVLNISASTTPCNSLLPSLVSSFSNIYPTVKFNITEQSSTKIIDDIVNLNCEIGLVGAMIHNPKISSYKITEDELVVISSSKFNLPKELTIDELIEYPFIMREKGSATRQTLETTFTENNIDLNNFKVSCEVDNIHCQLKFVSLGFGISFISKSLFDESILNDSITFSTINDINLKRNIFLVVSSKRTLTPTAKAFFNMCIGKFQLKI